MNNFNEEKFYLGRKIDFMMEKFSEMNSKLIRVAHNIKNKREISEYEIDLLNEAKTLITLIEFNNELDKEFDRPSTTHLWERTNILIEGMREYIYLNHDDPSSVSIDYSRYKDSYEAAYEDLKLYYGQQ